MMQNTIKAIIKILFDCSSLRVIFVLAGLPIGLTCLAVYFFLCDKYLLLFVAEALQAVYIVTILTMNYYVKHYLLHEHDTR